MEQQWLGLQSRQAGGFKESKLEYIQRMFPKVMVGLFCCSIK